ncbi:MAG: DUF4397 domain-containing protein [Acidimicrobiia bacterium]|nr:DUF4397 domain-containing protein [Acidimicrobiia bacterium]
MRKGALGLAVAVAVALGAGPAAAQEAPTATGTVTIVHGFRGLVADVYLDGTKILESFEPERSTDPVQLPAGDHRVEVREAGAGGGTVAAVDDTLSVPAGANLSAVVHTSPAGDATMTVFSNDLNKVAPGTSRLVVRHAASAEAVDVNVDGAPLVAGLRNPDQSARELPAVSHRIEVRGAGAAEPLVPVTDVPLQEGTAQYLYLIGAAEEETLGWITQTVGGLGTVPAAVNTGNSGLATDPVTPLDPTGPFGAGASAALLVLASALVVVTTLGSRLLLARR